MVDENSNVKTFPGSGSPPPSRTMPNNLQAEQNLLGAILLDNSVLERIDDRLLADHFYDPSHGRIFLTMQRLVERGQLANPVTLKSFFTDSDVTDIKIKQAIVGVNLVNPSDIFPRLLAAIPVAIPIAKIM